MLTYILLQCRWFNRDGDGLTVSDKIRLNCHITEIGMNCLKTCGCYSDRNNGDVNDDDDDMVVPTLTPTTQSSSDLPTYFSTMESSKRICDDEEGEFQTHVGASHFRQVRHDMVLDVHCFMTIHLTFSSYLFNLIVSMVQ